MRFRELVQAIQESMSFSAGAKSKDGYWVSSIDSGDRYQPEFYKNDWPHNKDPEPNPDYKPELDLNLANANMRQVFDELGYSTDLEESPPIDINEFIGRTTQWLQKAIDKPSPEEPTTVDKSGGGATMISGGKREGYFNDVIMSMNKIARISKQHGATHVWAS
jgi:hypothetical protein